MMFTKVTDIIPTIGGGVSTPHSTGLKSRLLIEKAYRITIKGRG